MPDLVRKHLVLAAAAVSLALGWSAASAAAPEFGTREGELACVALMGVGVLGARDAKPVVPQFVDALTAAHDFYVGRLSKVDPDATRQDAARIVQNLTPAERQDYAAVCVERAAEVLGRYGRWPNLSR